ncbi:MAG: ABC transporter ATP-binding protein [Anaerotruncus sp.]|nr:ABC transporter ATP-binding protein [Anaerotruncus sp.]
MTPLVDIQKLYKIYRSAQGEVHALDGVSLQIYEGEFVAIIGQSGAGKSTLMNMLGCLDLPDRGSYRLDGQDIVQASDRELAQVRNQKIGFIFQGFNLIPTMTALENVELPLMYRRIPSRERRRLASAALQQVGIGNRLQHRPGQLSGGQQQRVAIARAIAARPPILLADEPTGNLDSRSGAEIMEILWSLHRDGRTIILITHDNQLAQSAQRVIRIQDGRIAADRRLVG